MAAKSVPTWEQFVAENLLQTGLFSGICLISNQQESVYAHGSLTDMDKIDKDQFFRVFTDRESEMNPCFILHMKGSGSTVNFRIYHRTHVSVYATAPGRQSGLTVSKLPYGIFITLFHKPVVLHKAITLVENFTDKLRC